MNPYIPGKRRVDFSPPVKPMENAGDLNYRLAVVVRTYVDHNGVSYQTFNDVIGALDLLGHEIKRRFVDPYEDAKREENGDVFFWEQPCAN